MPSTLVHVALAGLFGAALLGRRFDLRGLVLLVAVVAAIDLDAFVGLYVQGAHRSAFHTVLIPVGAAVALAADEFGRRRLRGRYGARGVALAWTATFVYAAAGIAPDLFFNGVNLFYPLHDQFYVLDGRIELSNRRGLVQTVVDLSPSEPTGNGDGNGGSSVSVGSTEEVHYATGVDPSGEPGGGEPVERVFPLATSGIQLLIVLSSASVVTIRLWINRSRPFGEGGTAED